jgi:hypothetical protein
MNFLKKEHLVALKNDVPCDTATLFDESDNPPLSTSQINPNELA